MYQYQLNIVKHRAKISSSPYLLHCLTHLKKKNRTALVFFCYIKKLQMASLELNKMHALFVFIFFVLTLNCLL